MKFKEWLFNEMPINIPPHHPVTWWPNIEAKAKQLEENLKRLAFAFNKAIEIDEEELGCGCLVALQRKMPYTIRSIINHLNDSDSYSQYRPLSYYIKEFRTSSKIEGMDRPPYISTLRNIRNNIDLLGQFDDRDISLLNSFENEIKAFLNNEKNDYLDSYEEMMKYLEDNKNNLDSYEQLKQLFEESKSFFETIIQYIDLMKETQKAVVAWKERESLNSKSGWEGNERKNFPQHDKIEIMYHATSHVKEILSQGFKTVDELGGVQRGLGGHVSGISFTADINIARAIKEALIDVINIANGKLKIQDIFKMIKSENIPIKKEFEQWIQQYRYHNMKARISGVKDEEKQAFELYQNYLMNSKVKYNPCFFGVSIQNFKGLDTNNVGIISSEIQMDKVSEYLQAMEEFRVAVDGISNIKLVN